MKDRIKKKENEITQEEINFHAQSFYTQTVYYEDLQEMGTFGFKPDEEVAYHVSYIQEMERQLEQRKEKHKHFELYLNALSETELNSLYKRYFLEKNVPVSDELKKQTLEEIKEIETAIRYKYKGVKSHEIEPPLVIKTGNKEKDFEQALGALGVVE